LRGRGWGGGGGGWGGGWGKKKGGGPTPPTWPKHTRGKFGGPRVPAGGRESAGGGGGAGPVPFAGQRGVVFFPAGGPGGPRAPFFRLRFAQGGPRTGGGPAAPRADFSFFSHKTAKRAFRKPGEAHRGTGGGAGRGGRQVQGAGGLGKGGGAKGGGAGGGGAGGMGGGAGPAPRASDQARERRYFPVKKKTRMAMPSGRLGLFYPRGARGSGAGLLRGGKRGGGSRFSIEGFFFSGKQGGTPGYKRLRHLGPGSPLGGLFSVAIT